MNYLFSPDNLRWSLGSYDICFKNKPSSMYFYLGQVLPTHRLAHSPHGGLFQPTMTQCIRLLCRPPFGEDSPATSPNPSLRSPDITDPFSSSQLTYTYTTNGVDTFPAPSGYLSRKHSWVHIFPEGKIHQHPDKAMRYFKWGVARLILEAEPMPQIVPMWIDGFDTVMSEDRKAPRWMPRVGNYLRVVFGKEVDGEAVFGDLRERWRVLKAKEEAPLLSPRDDQTPSQRLERARTLPIGVLTDHLKFSQDAIDLRIECADRMRREILKLRRQAGYPDEDPEAALAETWSKEGPGKDGEMEAESQVKGS